MFCNLKNIVRDVVVDHPDDMPNLSELGLSQYGFNARHVGSPKNFYVCHLVFPRDPHDWS